MFSCVVCCVLWPACLVCLCLVGLNPTPLLILLPLQGPGLTPPPCGPQKFQIHNTSRGFLLGGWG